MRRAAREDKSKPAKQEKLTPAEAKREALRAAKEKPRVLHIADEDDEDDDDDKDAGRRSAVGKKAVDRKRAKEAMFAAAAAEATGEATGFGRSSFEVGKPGEAKAAGGGKADDNPLCPSWATLSSTWHAASWWCHSSAALVVPPALPPWWSTRSAVPATEGRKASGPGLLHALRGACFRRAGPS